MWRCRTVLPHLYQDSIRVRFLASGEPNVFDKLVYSSINGFNKEREIERKRLNFLKNQGNEIPQSQMLKKIRSENEDRNSGNLGPVVPVALQYLYQGSTQVQGPPRQEQSSHSDPQTSETEQIDIFPFALFDKVDFDNGNVENVTRKRLGRRPRLRSVDKEIVATESVDKNEEFEVITDNLEPGSAKKLLSDDDMFKYGSADPQIPPSKVPCGKCGAQFHCQDAKLPGFLPVEIFKDKTVKQLRHLQCQRCYIMSEYNIALKMNVSPDDYPKTIAHLRDTPAVIVLIVDLLDFPGSVWPDIMDLLGKYKRIILVGNKVDLLPQDSKNYLRRIEESTEKTFLKKCSQSGLGFTPKIVKTILVSARTGYNIEVLINKIFSFWRETETRVGGDIYLIGTTNVGKSSIFNLLLESDLCSIKAIDKVEKALTSPVPGTTLNLLKFPIMRPDPGRLQLRWSRLKKEHKVQTERERVRIEMLRKFKDRRFCAVQGQVGQTFLHLLDKNIPFRGGGFNINVTKPVFKFIPARLDPTDRSFAQGQWCFDSPGTVSKDQIINLLTQEEVMKTLARLPLLPRSFTVRVGQTLFVAGLARFDILDGPMLPSGFQEQLNLTVFTSDDLPINIVNTEDANDFYNEALGTDILAVPFGSQERLKSFPPLEGIELQVDGRSSYESSCDVVLSSAGWISCAPRVADIFKVKAWTPNGRGIFVREPPFLPHAIQLRGEKIKGTPAFKNNKFFIPDHAK